MECVTLISFRFMTATTWDCSSAASLRRQARASSAAAGSLRMSHSSDFSASPAAASCVKISHQSEVSSHSDRSEHVKLVALSRISCSSDLDASPDAASCITGTRRKLRFDQRPAMKVPGHQTLLPWQTCRDPGSTIRVGLLLESTLLYAVLLGICVRLQRH